MHKGWRRVLAAVMSLALVLSVSGTCAASGEKAGKNGYALSDYAGNEVLAFYQNGDCEAFAYSSQAELAAGLEALAQDDAVSFVQPNYQYEGAAESVSDELFGEQWALYNDGSFLMQEQENSYPVYDDPFGTPSAPGQWQGPQFGGMPGGGERPGGGFSRRSTYTANGTISSVSGVDINAEKAWALYNGGSRETVIALIDTGVDTSHEDFGDVFWVNEDEIAGNGLDDDGNGYADDVSGWDFYYNNNKIYTGTEDAHGTHGAGSIAASSDNGVGISGIVGGGGVKLMVLKALGGRDGSGSTEAVVKAIKYAEENGAVICNMSMGTESYDRALYQTMAASDMLFVVSAGNDGANTDASPSYPASFALDNIISVANLMPDGTLHESSNYGAESVDIAVPGTYILSLTTGDTYSYMTGTSMSAPILSAAAAMLYSSSSALSTADVRNILLSTAAPLSSLSGAVKTGGMLDMGAAMEYAAAHYGIVTKKGADALPFEDVSAASPAYEAIKYLYERGVMTGTSETEFSPGEGLTRAMTVTLLGRLAGASPAEGGSFSDVQSGAWYSGYVGWAAEKGIVCGYGNGLFGTNDGVTAEQLDLILSRYAALLGVSYESGLSGSAALTRAQTAQALYELCVYLGLD